MSLILETAVDSRNSARDRRVSARACADFRKSKAFYRFKDPTDFSKLRKQGGFTLLELSLVLIVVGVLLGGLIQPLLNNVEQLKQRRADSLLGEVRDSLLGFAARHGRLPCPALETSAGAEVTNTDGTGCQNYAGFLPVVELGLEGPLDESGILLDPWFGELRYRLSARDGDADGVADFAVAGAMRRAGLSQLAGDLSVSHWQGNSCDTLQLRASHVVAVVYSDAKNSHESSAENLNRAAGLRYSTGAFSSSDTCGFDDQLRWISDSALFSQMLRARQLP